MSFTLQMSNLDAILCGKANNASYLMVKVGL